jgi:hypothetical protein
MGQQLGCTPLHILGCAQGVQWCYRDCTPTTPIGGVGVCCARPAFAHPKNRQGVQPSKPRPTIFIIRLQPKPGVDAVRALPAALKALLSTAKTLGLKVPDSILVRADKVIQ